MSKQDKEIKELNIVKKTCKELGLTYRQLGEAIGVTEGALYNSASKNEVSKQLEKSLELLKENYEMKKKLEIINKFRAILINN